jgi:hypothetical protein
MTRTRGRGIGHPGTRRRSIALREVHEARQPGARGANVAYEIAQRHVRDQIVSGGNPGPRGAGRLPFGGR